MKTKQKFYKWSKEFFGNKFIYRFFLWALGFSMFIFGLAFFIFSRIGYSTYDTLLTPFRILIGVTDARNYGSYILIPAGVILTIVAFALNFIRTKKIRADYLLALVPIIIGGFFLDMILKIEYFSDFLNKTNVDWPFIDEPMSILWSLMGVPLFGIGLGIMSGTRFMPNVYTILVYEVSIWVKWTYKKTQAFFDGSFMIIGFLISIINIYTNRVDGDKEVNWIFTLHYIGITTILILSTQGILIGTSMNKVEKLFKYV